ncbi:hypothetical protein [Acetobacterium woodii]|uniref:YcxB-like protein domain-containing protein n=1 Tax=Acetobacterium woodii (strain ATCC 29683 / DSM 1030 / JCM 2381 / KCTC 1655 / WB1) TaxID=931626 RepID=H6LJQ6_ACEWD|nr:hypothetical protein [Acetobacterium woodii]AFA47457.1 hypothetical protein Awo_c06630 [Acetobacterium woodii DSM 1030]
MEPEFIVEIDCTKEELFNAAKEYVFEGTPYKKWRVIIFLCLFICIFPSLIILDNLNIFFRILIGILALSMAIHTLSLPYTLQNKTIGTQYHIAPIQLILLKKKRTAEDSERIKVIIKGHISGNLTFYSDHFEYSDIINHTYSDIQYFSKKNDHFILVSNSTKMVFLIKKSQFLQGNSEMFGQFINEKRNRLSTNKT